MKASILGEVIRGFNHQKPLSPERKEEWDNFYTETERKEIFLIKNEFLQSEPGSKVLFGGHSGNGKSTELNKFIFDPIIRERFEIIKIDVLESLDPNDIEIVEFLITICFYLLTFAEEKKITIDTYLTDKFKTLEGFFHNTLKIDTVHAEGKTGEVGFQGEGGSGFAFPFLKFKAAFYTKMRADSESRKTVRTEYRPRMSDLVALVKDLITGIKAQVKDKKELLILVDGLDRTAVKPAEKLFAEDGQYIALIDNVHMLLTVPISLIHSVKSAVVENAIGKMIMLKNLRLMTSTKTTTVETEKNRAAMKDLILRRMEEHLISPKALEMAITYSGGVFRTLIDLIATAALEAVVLDGKAIDEKDMANAVKEFRIKRSRALGRSHWEILIEIDTNKKFTGDMDERRLELLQGLYILEYINDVVWYRVNPILESDLDEWKQIIAANPR